MSAVEIQELGPNRVDDYLSFFDTDAFPDNPGWSYCYCAFYDHERWEELQTTPETRAYIRSSRADAIRSGQASGLLAYAGGKVVGWCNAGPRGACRNLQHIAKAVEDPGESVGSVRCFVVAPGSRGQGIATALLIAACEKFRRDALAIAEGYPKTTLAPTAENVPLSARHYHGPLSMFLNEGFTMHRQLDGWAVVRKSLSSRAG